ncbi:hypothetical protein [Methylomicrobium agile]|uniref:hypothetical protein n=1 Tax=Methylomicrobium agile TaxID=39774 RepID=UPI0004DED3E2|nr:hypothetical protein [Methylomicrobium agile]
MKTAPAQTPSSGKAESLLTNEQMTGPSITAKVKKQLTWTAIVERVGVDEVWLASACLGMSGLNLVQCGRFSARSLGNLSGPVRRLIPANDLFKYMKNNKK